jgi:hypothetical protein
MTRPDLRRLRTIGLDELLWRSREAAATLAERATVMAARPGWNRGALARSLRRDRELQPIRRALRAGRWHDAHAALATFVQTQPARFVITSGSRQRIAAAITQRFPTASGEAAARGDRLLSGSYDLLGYQRLLFDGRCWHTDVVHGRSAPLRFWAQVPYLQPECGDHKVTWEFNRHQHWLELGRAYWLTGDERYRDVCIEQLGHWLDANPPLVGINWASMLELAFRSLSWIWALHFFVGEAEHDKSPWLVDLFVGLDRQLAHVERHLSYYFSPNTHLLGEALALYVAGRTLPLFRRSHWREALGRRILVNEINRQVAADGGHCERSAHYHRYTLDFYLLALTVARLSDDPVAPVLERACARLGRAARLLADDRGILPLLGDDDGGSLFPLTRRRPDDARDSLAIAAALTKQPDLLVDNAPEEVWWLLADPRFDDARARLDRPAGRLAQASASLPATGYYISRNEHGDHLVIDCGPHGYLNGGHAHADALSLTFTHRRQPLLVDTGTGSYTADPIARDRFRSTALHNTLQLNERSQSVPSGPFHWRQAATGVISRWRVNRDFDYFVGAHDGYAPAMHRRHVLMVHGSLLIVADYVELGGGEGQPGPTQAAVHWHLHPAWSVELIDHGATLACGTARVDVRVAGATIERLSGDELTGLGWYAPAYGRIEPTSTLRLSRTGAGSFWMVTAFGLDPANAVQAIAIEPVDAAPARFDRIVTARLERAQSTDCVVIAEPRHEDQDDTWRVRLLESDARMLFTREVDGELIEVAGVDLTTVQSNGSLIRRYSTRVADAVAGLTSAAGAGQLAASGRKAS